MAEVKCSKCDRRYSALRTRCPYCGTRRFSKGKRAAEPDNSMWKLIIGLALLLVLVVAVIVLIVSATTSENTENPEGDVSPQVSTDAGENLNELENSPSPEVSPSPSPSPDIPATNTVEQAAITWGGNEKTDVSMKVGDKLRFGYSTVPADAEVTAEWASGDESVFVVLQTGEVTAIGEGYATLSVTVGGVTAECIIRVRAAS